MGIPFGPTSGFALLAMTCVVRYTSINYDLRKKAGNLPRLRPSKIPFGAFRRFFAVCCVHNLFVEDEQIPHLQPDRCFRPRTRRGRKRFGWVCRLRGKFCEALFDRLRRGIFPALCIYVFFTNFSRQRGQVMAILPLPRGTRTIWRHLGQSK